MRVLIILEDYRNDQYIAVPVVKAMLAALGKPRATVIPCTDPLLQGITEALNRERIREVIDRYRGMIDLFLLLVDRDGNAGRRNALESIESFAAEMQAILLGENAWQEIEVWALAGQESISGSPAWKDVRAERDPKERYFAPHAKDRGLLAEPGAGRKTMGDEAARNYGRLRQLCQEDIVNLEGRVAEFLSSH